MGVRCTLAALVATAALAAGAGPAAADVLTLGLASDGAQAGGADSKDATTPVQVSDDGSYVYFSTTEPLVPEDTDTSSDVYVRHAGVTTLVSDGIAPDPDGFVTSLVQVSSDGTKALLRTNEPLVAADGDMRDDVYIRDVVAGTTTLVSDGPSDDNVDDVDPATVFGTADLSKVAFATREPIDATNDTDASLDAYVWSGTTPAALVSDKLTAGPDPAGDAMPDPFADNGNIVEFSAKESFVAADTDSAIDVYQRKSGGPPALITDRVQAGPDTADDVNSPFHSADGSHVFWFTQEQLVDEDNDSAFDLYESVDGGPAQLVSGRVKDAGTEESDVGAAVISRDGTHVAWDTPESLTSDDTDTSEDVYERVGGVTKLVSDSPTDAAADAFVIRISADGAHIFFSTAEALVPEDGDSAVDVYDRSGGATTLVSDRVQAGADENQGAAIRGASDDGKRVFITTKEPLTSDDGDSASVDVYEHVNGATKLLTKRTKAGADEAADATFARNTPDGTHMFWTTTEQLVDADADAEKDVYGVTIAPDPEQQPPPGGGNPPPPGGGNPPPGGGGGLLPGACANVKRGTKLADVLTGTAAGDRISAGSGNDRVSGLAGADCLFGQGGNDTLNGGSGNDRLNGAKGKDKLKGGAGKDALAGGKGNDRLDGGKGNDRLDGGAGNDKLIGGKGKNRYRGGSGNDTINARNRKKETVNCGKGRKDRAVVDRKDKVKGCEKVRRK